MKRLPLKINPCPIVESVFEIRYSSTFPSDAVFGIIYTSVQEHFPEKTPQALPILQLPEAVRSQDPNLKYQSYYRFSSKNLSLSIGPRVLTFSNTKPYMGWNKWSKFFLDVLSKIQSTHIIDKVERIGLRYINIFTTTILDKINVQIKISENALKNESTNLRTEMVDSGFIKVLQIGNCVNVTINNKRSVGSMIDIDCLHNINDTSDAFFRDHKDLIEIAHKKEKELFFYLLRESFLATLNPEYEEQ